MKIMIKTIIKFISNKKKIMSGSYKSLTHWLIEAYFVLIFCVGLLPL